MHNPRNGPSVPAPFDLLPSPSCAFFEDLERTFCCDVANPGEISYRLPELILDDTVLILDLENI